MGTGRPKKTGMIRTQLRLTSPAHATLTRLAAQIPGMTANGLAAALIEQTAPQLEVVAQALEEQYAGQDAKAAARLIGIMAPIRGQLAALDDAAITKALEDSTRGTDSVPHK